MKRQVLLTSNLTALVLLFAAVLGRSTVLAQAEVDIDEIEIPAGDECAYCHVDIEELPADFSDHDVHFVAGLTCAGCHGGDYTTDDEDIAMSAEAGFIGVPDPDEIAAMCGKCHSDPAYMRAYQPRIRTDQESQYYTSGHGQALADGDENVATCASCHSAHSILPASDPRSPVHALNVPATCNGCHGDGELMAGYRLEHGVFDKYAGSVHGMALLEDEDTGAPACNDCHGNHGALPPEVNSLSEVCGTCHPNNQTLFEHSPMAGPFVADELHACMECHGHHAIDAPFDAMLDVVGSESICLDCHSEGDRGFEVADSMYVLLVSLVALSDSAESHRDQVAHVGMDDVDIAFALKDAHQALVQARTQVHSFQVAAVSDETTAGMEKAGEAIEMAGQQLQEHVKRRRGFAFAALFATILLIALYLKLRMIEGGSPTKN